jgi:oligopeptide transport system substrate-binding protein
MPHEPAAFIRTILTDGDYSGVAEEPYVAGYPDPYDLLSLYTANFVATWSDPAFDRMLTAATSIADPALRMQKLAECETTLLRAMPFVPLYFDTWVYLERPEVHGLSPGPMGYPAFKYAWIDTNRRPS